MLANSVMVTCTNDTDVIAATCITGYYLSNGVCNGMFVTTLFSYECSLFTRPELMSGLSFAVCTPLANATAVTCTTATDSQATLCAPGSFVSDGTCAGMNELSVIWQSAPLVHHLRLIIYCELISTNFSPTACPKPANAGNVTCTNATDAAATACDTGYYLSSGACDGVLTMTTRPKKE
jgi:hypothetical protein